MGPIFSVGFAWAFRNPQPTNRVDVTVESVAIPNDSHIRLAQSLYSRQRNTSQIYHSFHRLYEFGFLGEVLFFSIIWGCLKVSNARLFQWLFSPPCWRNQRSWDHKVKKNIAVQTCFCLPMMFTGIWLLYVEGCPNPGSQLVNILILFILYEGKPTLAFTISTVKQCLGRAQIIQHFMVCPCNAPVQAILETLLHIEKSINAQDVSLNGGDFAARGVFPGEVIHLGGA